MTSRDVVRSLVKIASKRNVEEIRWLRWRIERDEGDWKDALFTLHGRDIWREELDAAIEGGL